MHLSFYVITNEIVPHERAIVNAIGCGFDDYLRK